MTDWMRVDEVTPPLDRPFLGARVNVTRGDQTLPDGIWLVRGRHIEYAGGPLHWTWNTEMGYGLRITHWQELPPLPTP